MGRFKIGDKWYDADTYAQAREKAKSDKSPASAPVSSGPVSAPALTGAVATVQGVATPRVNLATRGKTGTIVHLGVGEYVDLTLSAPAPPGIKLKWSVQGDAELTDPDQNPALLTAGPTAGPLTVTLKIDGGPTSGHKLSEHEFKVVAPSGTVTRQAPNTRLRHKAGTASVGFHMWINLTPNDVVFNRVEWREHTGLGLATGHFEGENGRVHAPSGVPYDTKNQPTSLLSQTWMKVYEPHPAPYGINWVGQVDKVDTGDHPPAVAASAGKPASWKPSSHKWHIEWRYRVMKSDPKFFSGEFVLERAMHESTIKADGTATIKKADAGPFSKMASEGDSNYV